MLRNWIKLVAIGVTVGSIALAQSTPTPQERWLKMATSGQGQQVLDETTPALAAETDPTKRADILFVRARAAILTPAGSVNAADAVDQFIKVAPKEDRSAELLFRLARAEKDTAKKSVHYRRAASEYPTSYWGIMSQGSLKQMDGIGKPFDLQFKDAISGGDVSVQRDMKGKVVVVLYWATWCSDCMAEMPRLKQLYAQHKDKGVEFVGVSLDDPEANGGLTKLKQYVAENALPWPQYYQGNRMNSLFSSSWGVSSTPTIFVLDREGKLHATDGVGKLDRLIPELAARS